MATLGLNLSGGELGTIPGTYGTDYLYDGQASLDALAALGCTHLRVPIRMERLQPTPGAGFDVTEAGRLDALVARIGSAGMTCKLEAHQGGKRRIGGVDYALGSAQYPQADHVDFFARLAARYAASTVVTQLGYDAPAGVTPAATVFTPVVTRYTWESAGAGPLYPGAGLYPGTAVYPRA